MPYGLEEILAQARPATKYEDPEYLRALAEWNRQRLTQAGQNWARFGLNNLLPAFADFLLLRGLPVPSWVSKAVPAGEALENEEGTARDLLAGLFPSSRAFPATPQEQREVEEIYSRNLAKARGGIPLELPAETDAQEARRGKSVPKQIMEALAGIGDLLGGAVPLAIPLRASVSRPDNTQLAVVPGPVKAARKALLSKIPQAARASDPLHELINARNVLYHATWADRLKDILSSGYLRPGIPAQGWPGVSVSRQPLITQSSHQGVFLLLDPESQAVKSSKLKPIVEVAPNYDQRLAEGEIPRGWRKTQTPAEALRDYFTSSNIPGGYTPEELRRLSDYYMEKSFLEPPEDVMRRRLFSPAIENLKKAASVIGETIDPHDIFLMTERGFHPASVLSSRLLVESNKPEYRIMSPKFDFELRTLGRNIPLNRGALKGILINPAPFAQARGRRYVDMVKELKDLARSHNVPVIELEGWQDLRTHRAARKLPGLSKEARNYLRSRR